MLKHVGINPADNMRKWRPRKLKFLHVAVRSHRENEGVFREENRTDVQKAKSNARPIRIAETASTQTVIAGLDPAIHEALPP